MSRTETDSFSRALSLEIAASELLRMRVLSVALAVVLVLLVALFALAGEPVQHLFIKPVPWWLPIGLLGPFLAYELAAQFFLGLRIARGKGMPVAARFANAVVETSLPTVILWSAYDYGGPSLAFSAWPSMLYFLFIVAATLRLEFVLPAFTGLVAAIEYLALAYVLLPLSALAADPVLTPLFHIAKAVTMLVVGVVAGLVGMRLRSKFMHVIEEATAREHLTNLFGQHVSPAVVERLLDRPADSAGELREICVMFLDIRDFTAYARGRPPEQVVDLLNRVFAFAIDAVDRHHGVVNKFLGDGFMAMFGAPLDDPSAAVHAVAAARDILAEVDRLNLTDGDWRLRVGIGLHAGPAVTGNVGSPRRKEFTVIGDVVNLAARIEQLNKDFGSRLLVSDAVGRALGETRGSAIPLTAPVKGYATPLPVWRLD
jgi:adenylate cyclase